MSNTSSIRNVLLSGCILCFLTGCKTKGFETRLAATLLIGGIVLLATIIYLPVIAERIRSKMISSWGVNSIKKISNFIFTCFIVGAILSLAYCYFEMGKHVRDIWLAWSVIYVSFVFFQYRYRFLPALDDDSKKDVRKRVLGMIRSVTVFTIVFGFLFCSGTL